MLNEMQWVRTGLGSGSQTFGRGQIDKLMNQNIYALDALGGKTWRISWLIVR